MIYRIKHFKLSEFDCPCCGRVDVSTALIFWLDVFRSACGYPLVINSGFRCAARNAKVDGAVLSRHLIGCAADVRRPAEMEYSAFAALARRLAADVSGSNRWEIKTYASKTYIHFAVPRACEGQNWNGEREITL